MSDKKKEFKFYIIALVENDKGESLGVKKELPEEFVYLFKLNPYDRCTWFAPVGLQKKGETREEAAERIVFEETGYRVKAMWQIPETFVADDFYGVSKFFKIVVFCKLLEEERAKEWKKPDYIEEIKWVKMEDLPKYLLPQIVELWPEKLKKLILKTSVS